MEEEHPERSVTEAAEKAASAGDYASAERLLREAAALQEERLGPLHPELANTLNNLGVVCEIVDKPIDAERYLRRACAIAKASFEPEHPFVATSRRNLEDFCKTRRIQIEPPPEPARPDTQNVPVGSDSSYSALPGSAESPPVVAATWSHTRAAIAGAALLTLIATFAWLRARPEPHSPQPSPRPSLATAPAAAQSPQPPAAKVKSPDTSGDAAVTTPTSGKTTDARRLPPVAVQTRTTAAATPGQPLVAIASLCRDLATSGGWRCVPIENPVSPGPIFFYTRVKSSAATTVEHRWYRGDQLRQVIELRIHPNAIDGYRTYSRTTLDTTGTGDWRVELRTKDGALLHEERFVVR